MPAPRRQAPRRNAPNTGGLLAQSTEFKATGTIFTDSKPVEQPMVVRTPGIPMDEANRVLMKFSQLINGLVLGASSRLLCLGTLHSTFHTHSTTRRILEQQTPAQSMKGSIVNWTKVQHSGLK